MDSMLASDTVNPGRRAGGITRTVNAGLVHHQAGRLERAEALLAQVRALQEIAVARGQSLAQMALSWVLRHPVMASALIGASHVEQIEQAAQAAASAEFQSEELAQIEAILAGG